MVFLVVFFSIIILFYNNVRYCFSQNCHIIILRVSFLQIQTGSFFEFGHIIKQLLTSIGWMLGIVNRQSDIDLDLFQDDLFLYQPS